MDLTDLSDKIDDLEHTVDNAEPFRTKWVDVWNAIKSISAGFKQTRFDNPSERLEAWQRFQYLVNTVKEIQSDENEQRGHFRRTSEQHKDEILSCASAAEPPSGIGDALLSVLMPVIPLAKAALNAVLPGPEIDETLHSLQYCSRKMKEGWELLSDYKDEMTGKDKKEAFEGLKSAQDSLNDAWERWKELKAKIHEARQQAWEAKKERHEQWAERQRANIEKLEDRLERLCAVLSHKESHLEELYDKRDSARSDDFRSRVEEWIDNEQDAISDIRSKIRQVEDWLDEARSKLR